MIDLLMIKLGNLFISARLDVKLVLIKYNFCDDIINNICLIS